jgi:hypothetical protein
MSEIAHPLKYTFGYATGFIFLLGIMIYLYLLITDRLEQNSSKHSMEENIWIYSFLVVLIIGFIVSYYSIVSSIKSTNELVISKRGFGFGGLKKIPYKPTNGQNNIRFSKFTV